MGDLIHSQHMSVLEHILPASLAYLTFFYFPIQGDYLQWPLSTSYENIYPLLTFLITFLGEEQGKGR